MASQIGRSLYADPMIEDRSRLGYARVCVGVSASSKFPKYIDIDQGYDEATSERRISRLPIEYQWIPSICSHCKVFGHSDSRCPNKPRPDPNNVEVSKKVNEGDGFVRVQNKRGKVQDKGKEATSSSRLNGLDYASMTMAEYLEFHTVTVPYDPKDVDAQIKNQLCALAKENTDVPSPMESDGEVAEDNTRGNLSEREGSEEQILEPERVRSTSPEGHQSKTRAQAKRDRKKMREHGEQTPRSMSMDPTPQECYDRNALSVRTLFKSDQVIHVKVTSSEIPTPFTLSCMYARNEEVDHARLWNSLTGIGVSASSDPWLLLGDFNMCRNYSEMRGGNTSFFLGIRRFNDFLSSGSLQDLAYSGPKLTWTNKRFGDECILRKLDRALDNPHDPVLHKQELELNRDYLLALAQESDHFRLRARIKWSTEEDQCSRFFFQSMLARRNNHRIMNLIREDGTLTESKAEVANVLVFYFHNLYRPSSWNSPLNPIDVAPFIDKRLDQDQWAGLIAEVSAEEVKAALFSMGDDKAPEPDGFTSKFYKKSWEIVGVDVVKAVQAFSLPIASWARIKPVLSSLVDVSQAAFVLGRSIGDDVLLAQELVFQYHLHRGLPRCAMKVDLAKAYDTVEWDFLLTTLHLLNFPPQFCGWIRECVTTTRYSVKINGKLNGFFPGDRGLRQGDPLSPYLFVLVMQVLQGIVKHHTRASDF
ncbi:uncharacterized protein LOC127806110 [Diospyros lotus]|uniref:uncharacterized protein LOC127806110 n=1 Tax=Diospyros lotus TaxID=55363 RepID=UPI0022541D9E|nr:uncharacterized protein LOC127806110 [Diospyros lotus]